MTGIIELAGVSAGSFFIGLVLGAKIQKNSRKLEKWAREQLRMAGLQA